MPNKSFGIADDGRYFYRCCDSAVCFSEIERSFLGNANQITALEVTILPPGTVLTITL